MLFRLAALVLVVFGAAGCAAIPLGAMGAAAMSSGAGSAVKAGTEYTLGGTVRRTMAVPLDRVHDTALATLKRLGVDVNEEELHDDGRVTLRGRATERRVTVTLERVTPVMTRFGVAVRAGISKDQATTTEIMAQLEQALERSTGTGAASSP